MHPAKSVIYFTTASGAGYGLMVWLAVLATLGVVPIESGFGFWAFLVAFGLIVTGLLSSTLHLGHPERAWRALSQWKTSWLSREGVAAILGFVPMGLFGIGWVFLGGPGWMAPIPALAAIMALVTVFTTSKIYGSLKSIPAWNSSMTTPGYLLLSLATGGILAALLCAVAGYEVAGMVGVVAGTLLAISGAFKWIYWRSLDTASATSTAETATGLGKFGKVKLIEGPHTEANYLLEEMGFRVARKHADKLRMISLALFSLSAFVALTTAMYVGGAVLPAAFVVSVLAAAGAVVVERWLYFAEAKHVVTLYYGESSI